MPMRLSLSYIFLRYNTTLLEFWTGVFVFCAGAGFFFAGWMDGFFNLPEMSWLDTPLGVTFAGAGIWHASVALSQNRVVRAMNSLFSLAFFSALFVAIGIVRGWDTVGPYLLAPAVAVQVWCYLRVTRKY